MFAAVRGPFRHWLLAAALLLAGGAGSAMVLAGIPVSSRPTEAVEPVRYIAVGGGSEPASNQVSLEQDIALAQRTLSGPGVVLFAGGTGKSPVQVENPEVDLAVRTLLGQLFAPSPGRNNGYRPTGLQARPATASELRMAVNAALDEGNEPLLLYVATHGESGETPGESAVNLWGGGALSVQELATWHDESRSSRPLRSVITSCFSGGFAELVFTGGDPDQGPAGKTRCGLFATTWDRESTGCDPDPDRANQKGYGLYFLNALRGQDPSGATIPKAEIDLDGDGRISLLEAHTRARLASRSIDVPTTTSERWLRHVAEELPDRSVEFALPEEDAVIRALGAALVLSDEAHALRALAELDGTLSELDEETAAAEDALAQAHAAVTTGILEQWPVLDDPWHPQFDATLRQEGDRIARFITSSVQMKSYTDAKKSLGEVDKRFWDAELRQAMVSRLAQAYETRRLATGLAAAGGSAFAYYQQLLECERGRP